MFVPRAEKMAPKSAFDTLRCRILKRPHGGANQNLRPEGSREPMFASALESSASEVELAKTIADAQPSKEQKGRK